MRTRRACLLCTLVLLSLSPQLLRADDLADLLPNLFAADVTLAPTSLIRDFQFGDVGGSLQTFSRSVNENIASQLSTTPLGLSSAGFTHSYDPNLGVFVRSAESFGPIFAERSQTVGKGKWNLGLIFQKAEYDSIDGLDLGSGEIRTQLTHEDTNGDGTTTALFFEGDLIEARAFIDLSTETLVAFGTYGVTDRFDVSVSVPIVRVELEAVSELEIIRLSTSTLPNLHIFLDGSSLLVRQDDDSATGIGDMLVRGKYRFLEREHGGWAIALDLRLPTGDEDDLLGGGALQAKAFVIGSTTIGKFSPHVNFGFTETLSGDLPDEINYALGFDAALHPRVTLAVDLVGRSLLNATKVELEDRTFEFSQPGPLVVETTVRPVLVAKEDDLNQLFAAVGLKFNTSGNALISANALFSLKEDGLRDEDAILLVAFDYSF